MSISQLEPIQNNYKVLFNDITELNKVLKKGKDTAEKVAQSTLSRVKNALGFINTPNFKELQKIWEVNRKAQYSNYYDMFKSFPVR